MEPKRVPVGSRGVLLAVLLVAAGLYGTTVVGSPASELPDPPPSDRLVAPDGTNTSSYVWPYTSRSRSVAGRTLALNVVVRGDPGRVRLALTDRSAVNWRPVDEGAAVDVSPWRPAHGSVRYTYVTPARDATGRWIRPEYQLAVGSYFGQRTHVRAYFDPAGDWTALQAHTEYWDWFRVRHTVTGVATGVRFVERDLEDEPFVAAVSRTYHGHDGGGSDGWWTVVEFVPAVLVAAGARSLIPRRPTDGGVVLAIALPALVLGVRAWGLAAGAAFPGVDPKLFVAVGYPVVAVGPLALVARFARDGPPRRVALLAATGLGVGTALDLALVGVVRIPPHLLFHRVTLGGALGIVAFGTGRSDRRLVGIGLVAWVTALVAPLAGIV